MLRLLDRLNLVWGQALSCWSPLASQPDSCDWQGPRDDDAVFLSSDCDEQLLINLKFKQPVRLHSVALKSLDSEKAPKTIKIFVNPVNMSFDSAVRRHFLPHLTSSECMCKNALAGAAIRLSQQYNVLINVDGGSAGVGSVYAGA